MVMNTPKPGLTMMSLPMNEIRGLPLLRACWMVMTCWPTTDSTCARLFLQVARKHHDMLGKPETNIVGQQTSQNINIARACGNMK